MVCAETYSQNETFEEITRDLSKLSLTDQLKSYDSLCHYYKKRDPALTLELSKAFDLIVADYKDSNLNDQSPLRATYHLGSSYKELAFMDSTEYYLKEVVNASSDTTSEVFLDAKYCPGIVYAETGDLRRGLKCKKI